MDGVTSVTQCPTAPGESYEYRFRATQYGSSWYHSHFGLQAWEGIFGGIVINGPASANYDVDLGNLFIMDWDHSTADELYINAQTQGAISALTGLINGTNVFGEDDDADQTGQRFETTFESGTSYLIRLVNVAIDTHFKFTIDNHTMTVIASDFVPVTPYTTTEVSIGMGQRYDIVVTADQADTASDFWLRAIPQISCSDNDNADNIRGIIHYGGSTGTPTTTSYSITDECVDESNLVPVVAKTVGSQTIDVTEAAFIGRNDANYITWTLNSTSYLVAWEEPTLLDVYNNATSEFASTANKIDLPNAGEWVYLLITEALLPVAHPIHLHGHDFFVLGSGTTTYDSSTAVLNLDNPPRRDVALLPAAGWLMLAFQTDNPGAWIMHCHIGWHTLEGFALQFLEMEDEINSLGLIDGTALTDTCNAWTTYAESSGTEQGEGGLNDSGLKKRVWTA